ncbi:MAG: ATP-binding protein [Verrucomicrobia bacterium]|nr:ATP-binding protein [Verrucomicrobiota bacterium]
MNNWIDRSISETVLRAHAQFPALVLTGARQTGKTSLARHLLPQADYVTFDLPVNAESARLNPEAFLAKHGEPLILDEIQYVPDLLRYLKVAIDRDRRPGRFFLTGSQDFAMMQGVTESLAGRCAVLSLPPLSLSEAGGSADGYCWRGGYPELCSEPELDRELWLGSYLTTYLERDVRNVTQVSSLRDFDRFLRGAALRSGQLLSMAELARDVGVAPNTVKSWISILQSSHQIFLLEPYHVNRGKRLIKTPKLYCTDTGLMLYLQGFRDWFAVMESPSWGSVWENLVIGEVRKFFQNRGERPPLYFWRTTVGDEVDLLIEMGPSRFCVIECKTAAQIEPRALKGINKLKADYGKESVLAAAVVCRSDASYPLSDDGRVTAIPLEGENGLHAWLKEHVTHREH